MSLKSYIRGFMKVASVTGYVPSYLYENTGINGNDPKVLANGLAGYGAAGGVFRGLRETIPTIVNGAVGIPAGLANAALHGIAGQGWKGMKEGFSDSLNFTNDYFAQPIRDKINSVFRPASDMFNNDMDRQRGRLKDALTKSMPDGFVDHPGSPVEAGMFDAESRAQRMGDAFELGTSLATSFAPIGTAWGEMSRFAIEHAPSAARFAGSTLAKHAPAITSAVSKAVKPIGSAISKTKGYVSNKTKPIIGAAATGLSWLGRQAGKIPNFIKTPVVMAGKGTAAALDAASSPLAFSSMAGTTSYLNGRASDRYAWKDYMDWLDSQEDPTEGLPSIEDAARDGFIIPDHLDPNEFVKRHYALPGYEEWDENHKGPWITHTFE